VLISGISRLPPVPDAALGAAGYLLDAVGPLGVTSVLLAIAQPVLYHAYCILRLARQSSRRR
jgi:hypothetical protein